MIEKSRGFIIKRRVYRDTSLILTLYSYDFGKIEGIVKGVRRIEDYGRYDGAIDLFSNYEVVFYPKRSNFALFVQFYLLKSSWQIIQDYERFSSVCSGIELLDYIMQPNEVNVDVYELLEFFLSGISEGKEEVIFFSFVIKLLKFAGFSPQLNACLKCGSKIYQRGFFSVPEGSLICPGCISNRKELIPLSSGVLKSINYLERESYSNIRRFALTPVLKQELGRIIFDFISYHISFIPRGLEEIKAGVV